jgi:hypothetical protein
VFLVVAAIIIVKVLTKHVKNVIHLVWNAMAQLPVIVPNVVQLVIHILAKINV